MGDRRLEDMDIPTLTRKLNDSIALQARARDSAFKRMSRPWRPGEYGEASYHLPTALIRRLEELANKRVRVASSVLVEEALSAYLEAWDEVLGPRRPEPTPADDADRTDSDGDLGVIAPSAGGTMVIAPAAAAGDLDRG